MNPNPPQYPGQPFGQPPGAPGAPRTSGLAVAALILGILGSILPCPFGLISIGLGIAALVKIGKTPGLGGRGMAIAGIVLPIVVGSIVGILAAIAIPTFISFQSRAKQAECKSNLKSAFTAQMSDFRLLLHSA